VWDSDSLSHRCGSVFSAGSTDRAAELVCEHGWRRVADVLRRMTVYEYKVVELREKIVGGKMSGDKLQKTLNDNARQGWQLKAITAVEVKGRVGPGGVEGLLITFERAV
jgi:hypothetical protein